MKLESVWLSPGEIAKQLDPPVSTTTISYYADSGLIPRAMVRRNPGPRGHRRIHRDALTFLDQARRAA